MRCLDAHVHCGLQSRRRLWSLGMYLRQVSGTPIRGAAMFPFVRQIYDRWDPDFKDSPEWRQRRRQANEYLLFIGTEDFEVFPYYFIWNDFLDKGLNEKYCGIKWHRHADEPLYHYNDPRCTRALNIIRERNLPVVYEEEIHHTLRFIRKLALNVPVIIPHMGFLNGGYRTIVKYGLFERENVYTDTSLASTGEILDYLDRYGHERVLFGSDFPFGDPLTELEKILRLPISRQKREAIAGLNLQRLMSQING